MRDHKEVFTGIYDNEVWGKDKGSGTGSALKYCNRYIEFIEQFIQDNAITHVLDLGCGDWQFSQHVNWHRAKYTGLDVVKSVIEDNKEKFATKKIKFRRVDISDSEAVIKFIETRKSSSNRLLILVKDVLMHWESKEVKKWMEAIYPELGKGTQMLLTNNWKYYRVSKNNPDRDDQPRVLDKHSWAPLNSQKKPLKKYKPEVVFKYRVKQVSLITGV